MKPHKQMLFSPLLPYRLVPERGDRGSKIIFLAHFPPSPVASVIFWQWKTLRFAHDPPHGAKCFRAVDGFFNPFSLLRAGRLKRDRQRDRDHHHHHNHHYEGCVCVCMLSDCCLWTVKFCDY